MQRHLSAGTGVVSDGLACFDGVTVAGCDILAVWPGLRDRVYGAAVDVGSTTIAAHVCDLVSGEVVASAGAMNPQIQAHFIEAMAIPHKTAAYPELAKVVELPARKPSRERGAGEGGERRRRRR